MATIPANSMVVTNLVSSSGACRIQIFMGNVGNQTLILDQEFTATQNAALSTALAAAANTVTRFDFAQSEAPLPGIYNAI